jgi:hypothetical protein
VGFLLYRVFGIMNGDNLGKCVGTYIILGMYDYVVRSIRYLPYYRLSLLNNVEEVNTYVPS